MPFLLPNFSKKWKLASLLENFKGYQKKNQEKAKKLKRKLKTQEKNSKLKEKTQNSRKKLNVSEDLSSPTLPSGVKKSLY